MTSLPSWACADKSVLRSTTARHSVYSVQVWHTRPQGIRALTPHLYLTIGDYAPFAIKPDKKSPNCSEPGTQKQRNIVGASVDLVLDFAACCLPPGTTTQFSTNTTWSTLLADFSRGQFDMAVGGISVTDARREVVSFSTALYHDPKVAVFSCSNKTLLQVLGSDNSVAMMDELRGFGTRLPVVVNPGGTNERFVRDQLPRANVSITDVNGKQFSLILANSELLTITDQSEARLWAKNGLCASKSLQIAAAVVSKAWVLQKHDEDTADQWLWQQCVNSYLVDAGARGILEDRLDLWLERCTV